jgi:hypothetical protein
MVNVMNFPKMMLVEQSCEGPELTDIPGGVKKEIYELGLESTIRPGDSIAITVGSRGIANIALIIQSLVKELRLLGAEPLIIPAMGSHGGGTAEGQLAIVEGYGVTEDYVGAPIKSSMEVVQVGSTSEGVPVFCDRHASRADHVAVVNRIRPHTDFFGPIQSGLHKMMLIGMGKHHGAQIYHRAIQDYSWDHIIRAVGTEVIKTCKVAFGLGIVENQKYTTASIHGVAPADFYPREIELQALSQSLMPSIPFEKIDLLIIDQIGKNISGAGMDTNVIGRKYNDHRADPSETPKVTRIYVRGLTEQTHGNASGIGLAEFCHQKVVDQMDKASTDLNCICGFHPSGAAVPITLPSDIQALETALSTVGYLEPQNAKVVWIHNTLEIQKIAVSEALGEQVRAQTGLKIVRDAQPMQFDDQGDLRPMLQTLCAS